MWCLTAVVASTGVRSRAPSWEGRLAGREPASSSRSRNSETASPLSDEVFVNGPAPNLGSPGGEREASGGWGQRAPLSTWPHGAPPSGGEEPGDPSCRGYFSTSSFIALKFVYLFLAALGVQLF